MTIRVWAPQAERVDLVVGDDRRAMAAGERGWWSIDEVPAALATEGYRFSLDGGEPRPDPRSAWQPSGVDGPSQLVDPSSFPWTDTGWRGFHLPSAVLYELHVGTFSPEGTFDGAIERLDHLVDLGVDAIEVMPVAEFPGRRGWGYDGVLLYAPHHAYGGPQGLARLVDGCHARGLGVVLDVVYNHLGPSGNHLPAYGPYFTDRYRTPWGDAVNVDGPGSDEVRRFVIDNALGWLDGYHLDGLRLDAVHAINDASALHLLQELAGEVAQRSASVGRPLWLIAESDRNDPRLVRPVEAGGYGLQAQWSDEVHHALHALLTGERNGWYEDFGAIEHVARVLAHGWVYGRHWSPHRQRHHGLPSTGLPGWTFVASTQNHDQVGNRATGDRLGMLTDTARVQLAAGLLLVSPFVPLLFQGEEWDASTPFLYVTDHTDPELAEAVRRGRREEFRAFVTDVADVPDPQAPATLEASVLRWNERATGHHAVVLEWYRELLALRRHHPALGAGLLDPAGVHHDEDEGWLVLERGSVAVCCRLAPTPGDVPARGRRQVLLASGPAELSGADDRVSLPAWGIAILDR